MKDLLITAAALLVPFVIPCLTIWSHPNWKGVLLASITLWIFVGLSEIFLVAHYDSGGPAVAMFAVWVVGGLPASLILFAIAAWGRRRFRKAPALPVEPVK